MKIFKERSYKARSVRILPISQNAAAAKFHAAAFHRRWNFTAQILDFK